MSLFLDLKTDAVAFEGPHECRGRLEIAERSRKAVGIAPVTGRRSR